MLLGEQEGPFQLEVVEVESCQLVEQEASYQLQEAEEEVSFQLGVEELCLQEVFQVEVEQIYQQGQEPLLQVSHQQLWQEI